MASFQAKTGCKRPRIRENENYRSAPFLPDVKQKIQKNSKKIKKVEKYHYGFISGQKQAGKGGERDKMKIIVAFRSYPTRNSKFQQVGKGREREKIKIIGPFRSNTTRNRKFQKNSKI